MVTHTYNPTLQRHRQEDLKLKGCLGHTEIVSKKERRKKLKKKKKM
jgi:hypothetical protein